jgi:4-aminobutyrate aminotransferase/(S)-3-amino-2-methylpropionate transaminase
MSMPVIVERAGGGVIVDIDGNSIIDMGAGIAVVNVGNSADRVVANVKAQVEAFTHTCFMVVPYQGYIEVCEALNELPSRSRGDSQSAKQSSFSNMVITAEPTSQWQ